MKKGHPIGLLSFWASETHQKALDAPLNVKTRALSPQSFSFNILPSEASFSSWNALRYEVSLLLAPFTFLSFAPNFLLYIRVFEPSGEVFF